MTVPYYANENGTPTAIQVEAGSVTDVVGLIEGALFTHLQTIETFLAANPNGAILTAAQVAVLARMLAGIARILLQLTSTQGQAT